MNENKLKNFLVNGFQALDDRGSEPVAEEPAAEETSAGEETIDACPASEDVLEAAPSVDPDALGDELEGIKDELLKIRYILEDLREQESDREETAGSEIPDLTPYMTTREQFKSITSAVEARDSEVSNKTLIKAMEQIAVMREDFFRLCKGMREHIDTMTAESVLSSFEAYSVDMENILCDGGVYIGPFDYDRLNTLHQRIVGVIPTDDEEKNGMIAERLSDGYKIGKKVLLKEKVTIYKFTEAAKASETPSETVSEPEIKTDIQEEEE